MLAIGLLLVGALRGAEGSAAVCVAPSPQYPTIGAVLRDFSCTSLVLLAATFAENVAIDRDFEISGAGPDLSVVEGSVRLAGATSAIAMASLKIDGTAPGVAGCWSELLISSGGATLHAGADLVVSNTAVGGQGCRLFVDDFESGGTLSWSWQVP